MKELISQISRHYRDYGLLRPALLPQTKFFFTFQDPQLHIKRVTASETSKLVGHPWKEGFWLHFLRLGLMCVCGTRSRFLKCQLHGRANLIGMRSMWLWYGQLLLAFALKAAAFPCEAVKSNTFVVPADRLIGIERLGQLSGFRCCSRQRFPQRALIVTFSIVVFCDSIFPARGKERQSICFAYSISCVARSQVRSCRMSEGSHCCGVRVAFDAMA